MNVTAALIGPNRYEDKAAKLGMFGLLTELRLVDWNIISGHDATLVEVTQAQLNFETSC